MKLYQHTLRRTFLIVSNERLCDRLSYRVYLRHTAAAFDTNANVDEGERVLADDEHGLLWLWSGSLKEASKSAYLKLEAKSLRLHVLERSAVDSNGTFALFAVRDGGGGLLHVTKTSDKVK